MEGPDWLKYAVELQLLDLKPDTRAVLRDASITKIIDRLKSNEAGIPALGTGKVHYTDTGKAYWDLFFLADIGFTAEDLKLSTEIEKIFKLQAPDGAFITGREVKPNYFCMSAILVSSVARMGYGNDPRLQKYIRVILKSQGLDGGWHCYNTDFEKPDIDSCPMDNLNILMLLGQYEEYRTDSRFNGAIDLLLEHWNSRNQGRQLYGFGVGKRFSSLSYPAVKYSILRVLDVLSLFPYAVKKQGYQNMLDFVRQKFSDGRYFAESIHADYADLDFGQTEKPSRWLTFLVNRIEKRIG